MRLAVQANEFVCKKCSRRNISHKSNTVLPLKSKEMFPKERWSNGWPGEEDSFIGVVYWLSATLGVLHWSPGCSKNVEVFPKEHSGPIFNPLGTATHVGHGT